MATTAWLFSPSATPGSPLAFLQGLTLHWARPGETVLSPQPWSSGVGRCWQERSAGLRSRRGQWCCRSGCNKHHSVWLSEPEAE